MQIKYLCFTFGLWYINCIEEDGFVFNGNFVISMRKCFDFHNFFFHFYKEVEQYLMICLLLILYSQMMLHLSLWFCVSLNITAQYFLSFTSIMFPIFLFFFFYKTFFFHEQVLHSLKYFVSVI